MDFSLQQLLLWSAGSSCNGFSSSGAPAQKLWPTGLGILQHMEYFQLRDPTCVPALACRFLTMGPPGSPRVSYLERIGLLLNQVGADLESASPERMRRGNSFDSRVASMAFSFPVIEVARLGLEGLWPLDVLEQAVAPAALPHWGHLAGQAPASSG